SWYVPSYRYGEYKIWGLSAIMIVELVNLLFDAGISLHQPPERYIEI
ncbi:MAG: CoA pyrophosphatase, partial [Pseudomonas sp.]